MVCQLMETIIQFRNLMCFETVANYHFPGRKANRINLKLLRLLLLIVPNGIDDDLKTKFANSVATNFVVSWATDPVSPGISCNTSIKGLVQLSFNCIKPIEDKSCWHKLLWFNFLSVSLYANWSIFSLFPTIGKSVAHTIRADFCVPQSGT
jgi:hypothetical protein